MQSAWTSINTLHRVTVINLQAAAKAMIMYNVAPTKARSARVVSQDNDRTR